ncbi:MAG TPA: YbaK/EbsC family protein [bacterium]|nr:YbaK/EbsC family protein [bacterium]
MPVQRVKDYLASQGIAFDSIVHERTYTAQETAAVTHVKGRELAKAVVLNVDGECLIAVIPASRRLSLRKTKELLGANSLRLADESEFSRLFPGCELGAIPPLGSLFGVKMLVDKTLREDEEIAFAAGTHTEIVRVKLSDFENLESPEYGELISGE